MSEPLYKGVNDLKFGRFENLGVLTVNTSTSVRQHFVLEQNPTWFDWLTQVALETAVKISLVVIVVFHH